MEGEAQEEALASASAHTEQTIATIASARMKFMAMRYLVTENQKIIVTARRRLGSNAN